MNTVELITPCHFGLEAVLKREILDLGYEIVKVEDGRITFRTDLDGIARANIFLRTAERILLKIGSFKAYTFDDLFEGTKKLPWEDYIPKDGKFWVKKASSIKSKLFSPSDIQSIAYQPRVGTSPGADGLHGISRHLHPSPARAAPSAAPVENELTMRQPRQSGDPRPRRPART